MKKNHKITGLLFMMGFMLTVPMTAQAQETVVEVTTGTGVASAGEVGANPTVASAGALGADPTVTSAGAVGTDVTVTSGNAVVVATDSAVTSGEAIGTVVTGTAVEVESQYKEGLNHIDGEWYDYEYDENGVLVPQTGFRDFEDAGKTFYFGKDGKAIKNTLKKIDGKYYYFGSNGEAVRNKFLKINKVPYYFDTKGRALTNKLKKVGKAIYYFGSNGKALKKQFKQTGDAKYYFGSDYKAAGGWVTVKTSCYYFDPKSCRLKTNTVCDGYKLDKNGISKTRYQILQIVKQQTNSSMSKKQKMSALFQWLANNSYTYTRTYEHVMPGWKWYDGWTDDFASQIIKNHSGNCFRYAALYGYLVKEATGYQVKVYHGSTPSSRGGKTPHGWTTVNIGGVEYAFDPDMYKFSSKKSVYYYVPYKTTRQRIHLDGVGAKLY